MLKVLWLCSLYPNNVHPNDGDFVQRHAQAASLNNEVHVIKLTPDPDAKAVNKITRKFQQWPNLTETFVYYPKSKSFVGRSVSYFRWYSIYKYAVETYMEKNGKPDLIHVQGSHKSGVIAKLIKRKHNVPFVISEYRIIENNDKDNSENDFSPLLKTLKDISKDASGLHCTDEIFAEELNKKIKSLQCEVIPAVVADDATEGTSNYGVVSIATSDWYLHTLNRFE